MAEKKVLATLAKFNCEFERHKHIAVKFVFDLSNIAVTTLFRMRNFYVTLEEPDRGAPRKPLGEFSGKIKDIKVPHPPKKEGTVTMEFPDAEIIVDALRQIGECDPATAYLIQSELELELDDPDGSEEGDGDPGQTEIDDLAPDSEPDDANEEESSLEADAHAKGEEAFYDGKDMRDNPWETKTDLGKAWAAGFKAARAVRRKAEKQDGKKTPAGAV